MIRRISWLALSSALYFSSSLALAADPAPAIDPAVVEKLRELDPDALTPRQALDALYETTTWESLAPDACDAPDAGDHRGGWHVAAIHAIGRKLADLEERRAGIEQAIARGVLERDGDRGTAVGRDRGRGSVDRRGRGIGRADRRGGRR